MVKSKLRENAGEMLTRNDVFLSHRSFPVAGLPRGETQAYQTSPSDLCSGQTHA